MQRRHNPARFAWGIMIGAGLIGCSGGSSPHRTNFAVSVAPLSLPDIVEGCYSLTVTNAPGGGGDVVWSENGVCSTRYGDGRGAISYIGTCDADVAGKNTVILELTSLVDTKGPAAFVNPCGAPDNGPCQLEATCVENADTSVVFDLTIMRPARQGFFDIAVDFDDIFCSAKLDCQPSLLHHPSDPDGDGPIEKGDRGLTAVVGFACTAGPEQDTTLYWGPSRIVCRDGETETASYPIDPSQAAGQHGPIAFGGETPPGVFEHAIYRDAEDFTTVDKCFWNLALGLNPAALGPNCRFEATSSAGSEPLDELIGGAGVVYPILRWDVPLTDGAGQLACGKHPLNVAGSGVSTDYVPGSALRFETFAGCGEDPAPLGESLACAPALGGGPLTVRADSQGRFFASYGGQEVGPLNLPSGTVLADSCCVDACCASVEVP